MFKVFSVLASLFTVNAADKVWIDSETRTVRDTHERHIIFHGVNIVYKQAPYMPDDKVFDSQSSLTDGDIDNLVKWGFNFVRLGVMWEAVETAPGVYNDTYLTEVDTLITKLGKKGIYTLVDAHQDVMARKICGEGMPNFYAKQIIETGPTYCIGEWSDKVLQPILNHFGSFICKPMDQYGFKHDKNGNPEIKDCQTLNFFDFYYSPESQTIFRALYNNVLGMQDKYVEYWKQVTQKLKNNIYVVGYDPINEPMPSYHSIFDLVNKLIPGHYDRMQLEPLYKRLFETYQEASEDNIMMFEPGTFPDMIALDHHEHTMQMGFKAPPGGKIGSNKHIVNDHTYCCQLGGDTCVDGEPQEKYRPVCRKAHEARIGGRDNDAKRYGVPLIISEFGACMDSEACAVEVSQVGDVSDEHLNGWAYWEFKPFKDLTTSAGNKSEGFYNKDGSLQLAKVKQLSRTYVKAAQGTITEMLFFPYDDGETIAGTFQADIHVDMTINAPTVIHAQVVENQGINWYPYGVDITVHSLYETYDVKPVITWDGNDLSILINQDILDGKWIQVFISPKKAPKDEILIQ